MDKYHSFKNRAKEVAEEFLKTDPNENIRIVSHLDADGISAASILISALNKLSIRYSVSIVQQLNTQILDMLSEEKHNVYVFTDLGSGNMHEIEKKFSNANVFILDHHEMDESSAKKYSDHKKGSHITVLNPEIFDIDGGVEISGAGVVYLFAKEINPSNTDMAHIAVIGAIGDIQEKKGFSKLNSEILEDAKKQGMIKVREGLRVYGSHTRPLHKVLEYSTDPFIPGVSGSESKAVQFLHQIGIKLKEGNEWRKLIDLTDDEMKKLVASIVMKRLGEESPDDVLGFTYVLEKEQENSPLKDAKEFSTLLNACGRLDKPSVGIGVCLGDKKLKQAALKQQIEYKKEIVHSMRWYRENKGSAVINHGRFVIINAKDSIKSTMIGTLASMLTKSNEFPEGTLVLAMARDNNKMTKISLRIAGIRAKTDLTCVIKEMAGSVGGEYGGHMNAAGALIKTESEDDFLSAAMNILSKFSK